ncbi:MAG: C4-dicarboxylate ABC transporter permease [Clostridiales bacterium]|nr:C4-dicarboxylate ABC transporter permease [Clostridiales bacterium]
MFNELISGLQFVFQPYAFLMMSFGVMVGIIIGAIPGLSGSIGIILLMPLVYRMDSNVAMVMLCGLFCGSMFGGSVAAILLNTPGTPSAAATVLDGHPLARQGEAGKAIGVAAISSFIGGVVSTICLILIAPELAKVALKFHAADYFSLAVFGLTIMASASGKNMLKGLMSGAVGMLIATIGTDPIVGNSRFTFGSGYLLNGFNILPVLIGVFAISEVLMTVRTQAADATIQEQNVRNFFPSFKEFKGFFWAAIVGGLIGVFIGIVPGTGGAITCFLAYNVIQRLSRHPEKFGQGSLEGLAAAESANNGTTGGALIPMLTLGIPGDVVTSVMLGALTLIGVKVGPLLFTNSADTVYTIFAGMLVIQFLMLGLGLFYARVSPYVLRISQKLLMPAVMVLCVIGAFTLSNNLYHVYVAMGFGVFGFFMKKYGYPAAPLVLGVILGPMAEQNLNRALTLSRNDWSVLVARPISLSFLVLSVGLIALALFNAAKDAKKAKAQDAA